MKKYCFIPIWGALVLSNSVFADTSIDDMENVDGSKIQPSSQQIQQQKENAARVQVIKNCSSVVPATGQMDQATLDKVKKCLSDNNGYMPKQYQFTAEQTKPVQQNNTQQNVQQQAVPSKPVQPVQQNQTNTPASNSVQTSQQNLGPSYLR